MAQARDKLPKLMTNFCRGRDKRWERGWGVGWGGVGFLHSSSTCLDEIYAHGSAGRGVGRRQISRGSAADFRVIAGGDLKAFGRDYGVEIPENR